MTTKGGTRKFPSVTILSERPSATGRVVKNMSGSGVIMADEPNVVYVSSLPNVNPPWYGHWPLNETDIGAVLEKTSRREKIEEAGGSPDARVYVTYDGKIVLHDSIKKYFTEKWRPRDVNGALIPAIKDLREEFGIGLKDAKFIAELHRDGLL